MRLTVFCFLFISVWCSAVYAQHDSLVTKPASSFTNVKPHRLDSLALDSIAKASRQQFIADSIAMIYLMPDSAREDQFKSKIYKDNLSYLYQLSFEPLKPKIVVKSGLPRKFRDPWVVAVIIGLLIYTAFLNIFLGSDIRSVIQSFYNKHALSQLDKEGGLINSWAFIGLFILFSLTFGLVLYQLTEFYNVDYGIAGFQLFITFSVIIAVLFALKFLLLKFLGFIFDINGMVSQYIGILNLTYFNIAFVLLVVAICFSLLNSRFIPLLMSLTLVLIAVIFAWQYLRNSVNIISNFRFHKFYLFIYLCALEICPVLILIKSLSI